MWSGRAGQRMNHSRFCHPLRFEAGDVVRYNPCMSTTEEIVERIFTSPNPETGSHPPPQIAWVSFANGSVFFTAPTDGLPVDASPEAIAEAGKAALRELGPVHAGTPSADFNPVRLDGWYPDEPVWFVGFDHPAIATVLVLDTQPVTAGLEARGRRQIDHDELVLACVRGFDGTLHHAR